MFFLLHNSSQEDEDLEDGEIASEEEESSENVNKNKGEESPGNKPESTLSSPPKPTGKAPSHQVEGNDFEKDLQKLKEDVERKKIRKDTKKRRDNERGNNKRRKRVSSDEIKNRKEKKRKTEGSNKGKEKKEGEEDLEDDEMLGLCIRGASPTINLDQFEVWSGKQPILDPNWHLNENSENESDFEDRDDRKKRRRDKDRRNFKGITREDREVKKRLIMKRKAKNRKDDSSEMICLNFMKGNCNKVSRTPFCLGAMLYFSHSESEFQN